MRREDTQSINRSIGLVWNIEVCCFFFVLFRSWQDVKYDGELFLEDLNRVGAEKGESNYEGRKGEGEEEGEKE